MRNKPDTFGQRLVAARDRRDMTAVQLAARSGIDATQISHMERDRRQPSAETLRRLAAALDVSADFLLGLTDAARQIG